MKRPDDFSSYPLSSSLTLRIVNYLNIYRMLIAMLLGFAKFGQLMNISESGDIQTVINALLIFYLLLASCLPLSTVLPSALDQSPRR